MIRSFRDKDTERLLHDQSSHRFHSNERSARKRLEMLHAADELRDLGRVPGNRLEALKGSRKGQHSIRINDQWRICFRRIDGQAQDVEIVDYH